MRSQARPSYDLGTALYDAGTVSCKSCLVLRGAGLPVSPAVPPAVPSGYESELLSQSHQGCISWLYLYIGADIGLVSAGLAAGKASASESSYLAETEVQCNYNPPKFRFKCNFN